MRFSDVENSDVPVTKHTSKSYARFLVLAQAAGAGSQITDPGVHIAVPLVDFLMKPLQGTKRYRLNTTLVTVVYLIAVCNTNVS